jgi:D-alanyl-lipoteichoic acid acyltransferase DltB (MBOAT superfamily)
MFGLTVGNYFLGLALSRSTAHKKLVLVLTVAFNLLALAFFKYAYFARDILAEALKGWGTTVPPLAVQIILPLGISFFVFEFIHYASEVYKGGKPVTSFLDFALFASFFPTQIAGPIKRYQDFVPQLTNPHPVTMSTVEESARLITIGLVKKILFADYLAIVVHSAFEHPELLSSFDLWLAVYAFAYQIYFDFSAYTDIARGSALLFGFTVPPNFNLPYFSSSIAEFWRRWHISLSTWLRDYLFIPLGGSRGSALFTYRNLLITMVLGGIWHGAAGHFAIWGLYQGVLLVAHREFRSFCSRFQFLKNVTASKTFHYLSIIVTFHAVCIGWVFFRADSVSQAMAIIAKLLLIPSASTIPAWLLTITSTTESTVFLLLPFILLTILAGQLWAWHRSESKNIKPIPNWIQAVGFASAATLLIVLSPDFAPKFIYFQF